MSVTVAGFGQSLMAQMSQVSLDPPAPLPATSMFYPGANVWGPVTGNGAITYCNEISAALARACLDPTVRFYNAAVGGNGLLAANATSPHAFWLDGTPAGPLRGLLDQISAGGFVPDLLEYNGCQQDYLNLNGDPELSNTISVGMASLYSTILSSLGRTASQLPLTVWVPGKAAYGQDGSRWVMDGIIRFATNGTIGVGLGPSYYDLNYVDGTHLDAISYAVCGWRGARVALNRLGVPGHENSGPGPRMIQVDRVGSRLIISLAFGGGRFVPPFPALGFRVWSDDFSIEVPISYCHSIGRQIVLDLAYSPPWRVRVGYQIDGAATATWPMLDDQPAPLVPCTTPLRSSS